MEPVRRGRDDLATQPTASTRALPQWSPSGEDGTTTLTVAGSGMSAMPQWSPSGEDGTTIATYLAQGIDARRNGARPERTGRLEADNRLVFEQVMPQWSPSGEDGTTLARGRSSGNSCQPQWSPSGEDGTTSGLGR